MNSMDLGKLRTQTVDAMQCLPAKAQMALIKRMAEALNLDLIRISWHPTSTDATKQRKAAELTLFSVLSEAVKQSRSNNAILAALALE